MCLHSYSFMVAAFMFIAGEFCWLYFPTWLVTYFYPLGELIGFGPFVIGSQPGITVMLLTGVLGGVVLAFISLVSWHWRLTAVVRPCWHMGSGSTGLAQTVSLKPVYGLWNSLSGRLQLPDYFGLSPAVIHFLMVGHLWNTRSMRGITIYFPSAYHSEGF